jgi:predicted phosphodiesterase
MVNIRLIRVAFLVAVLQVFSGGFWGFSLTRYAESIGKPNPLPDTVKIHAKDNDSSSCADCIRIVQISDVQLGFTHAMSLERATNQKIKEEKDADTDARYFALAVNVINKLCPKPDVVVSTGDMVNDPENQEQWNEYMRTSGKINAPVFEVMGNHDGWTSSGIAAFKERFHRNDYYSFSIKECLFVVLNSWYLKFPEKNPEEAEKQKQFLANTLKNDVYSGCRIMLLHFPPYLKSPDEKEAYFNLPVESRKWLLDVALKNKVGIILAGHCHLNNLVTYRDSVNIITTGPVSQPLGINSDSTPSVRGFRIIDINRKTGTVSQKFVSLAEEDLSMREAGSVCYDDKDHNGFSVICLCDTFSLFSYWSRQEYSYGHLIKPKAHSD